MTEISEKEQLSNLQKTVDALLDLVRKIVNPEGKIVATMTIEELTVYVIGETQKNVTLDVSNAKGQIVFCAISDFNKQPFTFIELQAAMKERLWTIPQSSLYTRIGELVKAGLLIKEDGIKYRLPNKVNFINQTQ